MTKARNMLREVLVYTGAEREIETIELDGLGISLPHDIVADLDTFCEAKQIDRSAAVRRALNDYPSSQKSQAVILLLIAFLREASRRPVRLIGAPFEERPAHSAQVLN